jgi:uncharacterized protein (DUF697 family)
MARLHPLAVYGLLKELRSAASEQGPVVVMGAPALTDALRKELIRGGQPDAVRQQGLADASALVYVLAAPPTDVDKRVLKQANRERVPIICVLAGPDLDPRLPYVLATDVVRVSAGSAFPLDEIARALADRLGEDGTALSARLPVLRDAVCERLIARFARRAGITGLTVFVPGADLPVLTLMQLRLVLRIGAAHGVEIDRERLPEVLATIGSGLAFRAVARQALGFVPVAGWLVKGAVAYAGTKALGEAAVRYFAARAREHA